MDAEKIVSFFDCFLFNNLCLMQCFLAFVIPIHSIPPQFYFILFYFYFLSLGLINHALAQLLISHCFLFLEQAKSLISQYGNFCQTRECFEAS